MTVPLTTTMTKATTVAKPTSTTRAYRRFAVAATIGNILALAAPARGQDAETGGPRPRATVSRATLGASGPPVDVLCAAAVTQALAEPERARSFLTRARAAGWLPEVRFRVYRRFARTEGLSFDDAGTGGVVAPVDISAIDDVRYEWRATWDLSRIVFNPDELQAHAEALRMSDVRRDIQALVIRLYFERRRLMLDPSAAAAGDAPADARGVRAGERVAEIEAQLDALSGGAFSGWDSTRREAAPGQ
jgi:hypothetical protein